jgi:hypothetical protein
MDAGAPLDRGMRLPFAVKLPSGTAKKYRAIFEHEDGAT